MQRIVHLDFKGAPPRISFLEKVLLTIKSKGTTGVLIEWEDTFPYLGDLVDIGSVAGCGGDDMYKMDEVKHIFQFCKDNGIEIIQTIPIIYQTEFVLKHPTFKNLRINPDSPSEINLSNPATLNLVYAMLEQILELQPYATNFLLGPIAVYPDNLELIDKSNESIKQYLGHIRDVASFLKKKIPNLTVLVRDDFLKMASLETLKEYNLGDLIQPVVCHSQEHFSTDAQLWSKYSQLFSKVWAGSAFRGADGASTIYSESDREANNHESWRKEIGKYSSVVHFAGIILVGWSRYDHYGALCELLPVSLPHIDVCYNVLEGTDGMDCPLNEYPGAQMSALLYTIDAVRSNCMLLINSAQVSTWLNSWQIQRKYTSEAQVQGLVNKSQLYILLCDLVGKQNDLIRHLNEITGPRSAGEWIKTYISPVVDQMSKLLTVANERCKAGSSIRPEYT